MELTFLDRFKVLSNAEALYYLIGKLIAAIGLGILLVHWLDFTTFLGWILLVLGVALALPPSLKIFKLQKQNNLEKKRRR